MEKEMSKSDKMKVDILNILLDADRYGGVILSTEEIFEVYKVSKGTLYKFIDFLKALDFIKVIWIDSKHKKVVLREDSLIKLTKAGYEKLLEKQQ